MADETVQGQQLRDTLKDLRGLHGDLIKMEQAGRLNDSAEAPGLIGDYLTKLRLKCSLLFSFENRMLDQINLGLVGEDGMSGSENQRQKIYEAAIKAGKSPSAAEAHAREMTRGLFANIKVLENKQKQIHNEWERYNGICISLQSRMKEFDTERRMG